MKHEGTLEDLKTIIRGCGFNISEVKNQDHGQQIKTKEGAIVNWYTSTGTINVQGKKAPREKLIAAWESYTGTATGQEKVSPDTPSPEAPSNSGAENKKVFVVHGHDTTSKKRSSRSSVGRTRNLVYPI